MCDEPKIYRVRCDFVEIERVEGNDTVSVEAISEDDAIEQAWAIVYKRNNLDADNCDEEGADVLSVKSPTEGEDTKTIDMFGGKDAAVAGEDEKSG